MQRVGIAPAGDARARRWRFALLTSVLQAASVDVFATIRQYALAKPCEANVPRRRRPNPTILHLLLCLGATHCDPVRGPGIDCKHGTSSSSLHSTNASHLSRNSCSPAARGAHTTSQPACSCSKERRTTSLLKDRPNKRFPTLEKKDEAPGAHRHHPCSVDAGAAPSGA